MALLCRRKPRGWLPGHRDSEDPRLEGKLRRQPQFKILFVHFASHAIPVQVSCHTYMYIALIRDTYVDHPPHIPHGHANLRTSFTMAGSRAKSPLITYIKPEPVSPKLGLIEPSTTFFKGTRASRKVAQDYLSKSLRVVVPSFRPTEAVDPAHSPPGQSIFVADEEESVYEESDHDGGNKSRLRCDLCDEKKYFNSKRQLKRHIDVKHTKVFNPQCVECPHLNPFSSKRAYDAHVAEFHDDSWGPSSFRCYWCHPKESPFSRKSNLKTH